MPIDVECSKCRRLLRVAEEYAGQQAKCPQCGAVFEVPKPQPVEAPAPEDAWHLKTPEGRVYGPVSKDMLRTWVDQGRVADDCELRQGPTGHWKKADEVYPELRSATPTLLTKQSGALSTGATAQAILSSTVAANAGAPTTESVSADSADRASQIAPQSSFTPTPPATHVVFLNPHRGALILTMGIFGIFACPVFGFMAWTMGAADLEEMRQGRMDPSGRGPTFAGHMLGMIISIFSIIACVGALFCLLFVVAT